MTLTRADLHGLLILSLLAGFPLAACSSAGSSGTGGSTGGTASSSSGTASSSSSTASSSGLGGTGTGTTTTSSTGSPESCHNASDCLEGGNVRCFFHNGCFGNGNDCFTPGNGSKVLCTSSADCGGGFCRQCGNGTGVCDATSCTTNHDCGDGYFCDADKHCQLNPCTSDADCSSNFRCGAAEHTCQRRPCQANIDCGGVCVEGFCNDELGYCHVCI